MSELSKYESELLKAWEEVYKKSQLTLWILLALKDGLKHMAEIRDFIKQATSDTVSAEDQSLYRALRRCADVDLIDFVAAESSKGPDLKKYQLTGSGKRTLDAFVRRNIEGVYYKPANKALITRKDK